jgi:hypothetical protein
MHALVNQTTDTAKRGEQLVADLAADAENEDLTESDRRIYDEIIAKLNIIVGGVSGAAQILSPLAPTVPQDAPPDPERNAGKEPAS